MPTTDIGEPRSTARSRRERIPREERRRQIIEAAATLFSRKGFRGTTTREIAGAVGVSEAMLFKHFATKEELYAAIIAGVRERRPGPLRCAHRIPPFSLAGDSRLCVHVGRKTAPKN